MAADRKFRRPTRNELDDPTQRERVVAEMMDHIEYLHTQTQMAKDEYRRQIKSLGMTVNTLANKPEKVITTVNGLGGTLVDPQPGKALECKKLPAVQSASPGQMFSLLETDGTNVPGLYVMGIDTATKEYKWVKAIGY